MATKKKVILEGEIKTTIANAQEVTSKIQDFKKQLDALEMPKEATKAFEKAFDKVLKGLDEFEIKAGRGVSSLADTKDLERAWKAIIRNIDSLEVALRGLNAGDIFPKEVKNNIESAQKALDKYVKKLAEAKQSEAYKNKAKSKNDLIESKGNYEKELKNAKQRAAKEEGKYETQRKKWGETEQKQYEAQVKALEDKTKARDEYLKTQKKAEKEALRDALQKQKYITEDPKARGRYRLNLTTARTIAGKEDGEEKEAARKKIEEAENVLGQLAAIYDKEKTMDKEIAEASEIVKGLKEQKDALDEAEKSWKDAQDSVEIYTKKIEDTESAIKQVDSELETMSLDEAKKEWEAVVKVFQDLLGIDLSGIAQDAELVQKQLTNYQTDEVKKLPNIYELLKKALGAVGPAAKQAGEGVEGLNAEAKEVSEAEKDINNLKRQLLDFFSISNAIELFKRAIRSAIDTVKELDAVMTETAVVTDFSIGDMWDKLPDYADKASDLGTSIAELYSATTLYYQQGLKTNEAMGVGVETMKMARIAGMDATDATTAMTAALRGFNMAVDEMNAQKVNDVYSELAAITAADTNQIATAMGKTASIAASANMEFETTAAFLAQIIETTQEAPETAGTALKTIIARFTEVKELFDEGMLTGEDSEGEEININKIDEALRTVGISLKDFLNGSKGMDDIFLELASKWDSLDLATQRYIATAAAGSRQQSRFIAMMSNYGRTMELVDAANNSAGASQKQYAKTLESLDTKLQQLKNAWDTFAMGLADNETIKVAVDILTKLLEVINQVIDFISGGNGVIKSLISLGAAFGALKVSESVLQALFATVTKAASKDGFKAGETFSSAFSGTVKEKLGGFGDYFKELVHKPVGKAAIAVGALSLALTAVNKGLEKTGHKRGAEGLEALASGASVAAGILSTIPALIKIIGATAATAFGWISIILTALVSVGVAASKWIEDDTEKLERLNEEAREAADAAKEAKEAYDALLSNKSEYSALQEELENLIKGTDEWRKKLVEVNSQVLELINTYPELAKYLGRGGQGQLTLLDEGWSELERLKQEQITNTQAMSTMANLAVTGETQNQKREEIKGLLNFARLPSELSKEILDAAETGDSFAVEQLINEIKQKLWEDNGYKDQQYDERVLKDELGEDSYWHDVFDEIRNYQRYMQGENLTAKSSLSAFLGAGLTASSSKYGSQVAQAVAGQDIWNIDNQIEERAKALKKNPYLAAKYEQATGKDSEGMTKDEMASALAKIEIGKELSGQVDKIISYLENLPEDQADRIAAVMSGDISDFTTADANNLESSINWEELAKSQGYADFAALAEAKGYSEEAYKEILLEPFEDLGKKMKALFEGDIKWAGGKAHLKNATYGQQQAYAEFAHQALGVLGEVGAKNLVGTVDKLLANEKTRDQVFELLGDTNFQKEGAAKEFIADLEKIGVDMDNINIDSFIQDLNKLNASFKKFDLKSLMDQSKKLLDLSDDLKIRDAKEGMTDEERAELLTIPGIKEEDFAWTGQEWIYLGDTMEGLSRALRENTEAILEQKMTGLEEQIATGEKLQEIFGDDNNFDIAKWGDRGQKIFESLSLEKFLKGREGTLTAADIRSIFGKEAGTTDDQAWALFDKYKFAYDNLTSNKNTYDLYSQNMGTAIAMSGYLGQSKGTAEDYKTAVEAKEKILGTEQLTKTLEGLFGSGAKSIIGFDTAVRALAADLGLSQQKMKNFVEVLGDVEESLTKGKRGTEEYSSAWRKVEDSLKDVFGEDALEGVDISQELMEKMVSGSKEAFAEVEKIIQANAQKNLEAIVKQTAGTLDGLQAALPELQTNITTTYDPDQLAVIFGDIITQADNAAAEARARIAEDLLGLGLQVAWSLDEEGKVTAAEIVNIDRGNLFKNYSSSSGGSSSKWENPYDKLHNVVQRINAELRIRERLERQYQRILENEAASSAELAENARKQIESLEYEKRTREYLVQKRKEELAMVQDEYKDVSNYASWDDTLGVILNQEALAALNGSTNEKLTERVDKYIEEMQEKFEQIQEEIDAIDEIEDFVKDIKKQGESEYFDLENTIKDALLDARQKEIDKLTEINDSINNSNSRMIQAMQENLDKERQSRENNKTEEDLEKKRQRLAQLQMDTSGSQMLEILALEEEIAEAEQAYVDTLIDQKIQDLQDQNEKAYEQRQHQIEILQWQKDHWEESGEIWKDVNNLFQEGFDSVTGEINPQSKLAQLLKASNDFNAKSQVEQQKWLAEFNQTLTAALGYLELSQQLEDIGTKAGTTIDFYYNGELLSGIVDEKGNVVTADGRVFNNVYKGLGSYYAGKNAEESQREVQEETLYKDNKNSSSETKGGEGSFDAETYNIQKMLKELGLYKGELDGISGPKTREAIAEFKNDYKVTDKDFLAELERIYKIKIARQNGGGGGGSRFVMQQAFATGGLADFTGPAWLDGTKAKPEYVLNAAQTERFFTLVDVLDSLKSFGGNKSNQISGDNIVDIDINIETVKEEADVDMLAEKVQRAIVTSAQYRNNSFVQR